MGTLLSFHRRNISTQRLVVILIVILSILVQQLSGAAISTEDSLSSRSMNNAERNVRHAFGKTHLRTGPQTRKRTVQLKCRCTGNYIRIYDKTVSGDDVVDSEDSTIMEIKYLNTSYDEFYLQRKHSDRYLCFTSRGRLRVESGHGRGDRCKFRLSAHGNQYQRIQSIADPLWYVGFKRRTGKPMRGWELPYRNKRCFDFLVEDHSRTSRS